MSILSVVEPIVQQHLGDTFPACSVCVVHRGDTILDEGWGWIDPETKQIPVTKDTLFDLASVSKLFTATAFLSYVSGGAVKLDDPLIHVVPEFGAVSPRPVEGGHDPHSKERQPVDPLYAGQVVDPAAVTFRQLLTHTSGLPPWRDVYNAAGDAPPPVNQADPVGRAERWARGFAAVCGYPFVGQPDGKTVRYSDIGLMLLGEATARLHGGEDLLLALEERVFKPLCLPPIPNLGATKWRGGGAIYGMMGVECEVFANPVREYELRRDEIAPTEDDPIWRKRRVWGEVHDENACGLGGVAGHAGLFGTGLAVSLLGQAWLEGAGRVALSPDVAREAVSEQVNDAGNRRGLGFALKAESDSMMGDRASERAFGHTGFTGTSLMIDPERELVVVLLTNRVYPGRWHEGAHGGIHGFRRAAHDAIVEAVQSAE